MQAFPVRIQSPSDEIRASIRQLRADTERMIKKYSMPVQSHRQHQDQLPGEVQQSQVNQRIPTTYIEN